MNEDQLEWRTVNGYFRKILLSEDDLESPGNVVQLLKVEPGSEIKPHYHEKTTEVFLVLRGEAILFVGKDRSMRRYGDTILCKRNEIHGVLNNSKSDFVIAVFKLNASEHDIHWELNSEK